MRLLIVTQAVDRKDTALGFFHDWLTVFSQKLELLTVICLRKGESHLAPNVRVLSLGKEKKESRLRYILNFYKYILSERHSYDAVFVHMNPEYVILGGIVWKLMGKKIILWYTHRQVNLKLRVAAFFADEILTAAPESFNIKSSKVHSVGHGIDVAKFSKSFEERSVLHDPIRIISIGRITPIKNLDVLIDAVYRLKAEGVAVSLQIVGDPAASGDVLHLESLKDTVRKLSLGNEIAFIGKIENDALPEVLSQSDLSINLTPTGGIDKAVLESMAAGAIPLTSNNAFRKYFDEHSSLLIFAERDVQSLEEHIKKLITYPKLKELRNSLKKTVEREGGVELIVDKILEYV
jgi:glycosyltransferase involved in cell wall biosynthesis